MIMKVNKDGLGIPLSFNKTDRISSSNTVRIPFNKEEASNSISADRSRGRFVRVHRYINIEELDILLALLEKFIGDYRLSGHWSHKSFRRLLLGFACVSHYQLLHFVFLMMITHFAS